MDGFERVPERMRRRMERLRLSPREYEKLREKVREHGPEFLEREMQKMEALAELKFAFATEPAVRERMRERVQESVREEGVEAVLDASEVPPGVRKALEEGKFIMTITSNPKTAQDQLMVVPEGNVQEAIPVKPAMSEQWVGQIIKGSSLSS